MNTTAQNKTAKKQFSAFTSNFMRMMMHLSYTQIEIDLFLEGTIPPGEKHLLPLVRPLKEVCSTLQRTARKLQWFKREALQRFPPERAEQLTQELDLSSDRLANIAQLTEMVLASDQDLTDEIDLVVNHERRKELLWKVWRAGCVSITGVTTEEQDRIRFNNWYQAHYETKN